MKRISKLRPFVVNIKRAFNSVINLTSNSIDFQQKEAESFKNESDDFYFGKRPPKEEIPKVKLSGELLNFQKLLSEFRNNYNKTPKNIPEQERSKKIKLDLENYIAKLDFYNKNKIPTELISFLKENKISIDDLSKIYKESKIVTEFSNLNKTDASAIKSSLSKLIELLKEKSHLSFNTSKEIIEFLQFNISQNPEYLYEHFQDIFRLTVEMIRIEGKFEIDFEALEEQFKKEEIIKRLNFSEILFFTENVWHWDEYLLNNNAEFLINLLLSFATEINSNFDYVLRVLVLILTRNLDNNFKYFNSILVYCIKFEILPRDEFQSILIEFSKRKTENIPRKFYSDFIELYLLNKYKDLETFVLYLKGNPKKNFVSEAMKKRINENFSQILTHQKFDIEEKIALLLVVKPLMMNSDYQSLLKTHFLIQIKELKSPLSIQSKNEVLKILLNPKTHVSYDFALETFKELVNNLIDFSTQSIKDILVTMIILKESKENFFGKVPEIELNIQKRINAISIESLIDILKCGDLFSSDLNLLTINTLSNYASSLSLDLLKEIVESLGNLKINNPQIYALYENQFIQRIPFISKSKFGQYLNCLAINKMGSHEFWLLCEKKMENDLENELDLVQYLRNKENRKWILDFFTLCVKRNFKCEKLFDKLCEAFVRAIQIKIFQCYELVSLCNFISFFKLSDNKIFYKLNAYFLENLGSCNIYEFTLICFGFSRNKKGSLLFWDKCMSYFISHKKEFNFFDLIKFSAIKEFKKIEKDVQEAILLDLENSKDSKENLIKKLKYIAEKKINFSDKKSLMPLVAHSQCSDFSDKTLKYFLMK